MPFLKCDTSSSHTQKTAILNSLWKKMLRKLLCLPVGVEDRGHAVTSSDEDDASGSYSCMFSERLTQEEAKY